MRLWELEFANLVINSLLCILLDLLYLELYFEATSFIFYSLFVITSTQTVDEVYYMWVHLISIIVDLLNSASLDLKQFICGGHGR